MASAVTEIGSALLKLGAQKLYDDLTGRKYGDATQAVSHCDLAWLDIY